MRIVIGGRFEWLRFTIDCWVKQKPRPTEKSRRFYVHIDLIEIRKSLIWIRYAQTDRERANNAIAIIPPPLPLFCSISIRNNNNNRSQFNGFFFFHIGSMTNNTRIDIFSGQNVWTVWLNRRCMRMRLLFDSLRFRIETANLINMYHWF